jgi:hypothetical protein
LAILVHDRGSKAAQCRYEEKLAADHRGIGCKGRGGHSGEPRAMIEHSEQLSAYSRAQNESSASYRSALAGRREAPVRYDLLIVVQL